MTKLKTLYLTNRKAWRKWLEKNFESESEIWLIFPHKSTGKPRISYNDAVEEALCFGWIDSIVKTYDPESSIQKFTPRNPKSGYSQPNKERLRLLRAENLIHSSMQDTIDKVLEDNFVFPPDIINAIKKEKDAWKNYQKFSDSYKRIRIAYIDSARSRPDEFEKRLKNFINKTKENKLIGYGGIEKYY